ncbi:MAG TPA: hypothetical protein VNL14_11020 [Candidatus Acidoferrales bacterium]|nr:hypothetical protein [Candidatus Acidoferrales bacterium]
MQFREHPKIGWPLTWSDSGDRSVREERGILKAVDLVEPRTLLLSNDLDGKLYFAEIECPNGFFASRLHDKMRGLIGRPIKEVGELDLDS